LGVTVKLANENAQFFHTLVTIAYKKKFIVTVSDQQGNILLDHSRKQITFGQPTNREWELVNFQYKLQSQ
jgi:hypothetical protein